MSNVSYTKAYENFTIAVIPIGDKYDVQFMLKNPERSVRIELCNSEHHAVEGAKKFPTYYEIAFKHGFIIANSEFKHRDGGTLHFSFAMDLDQTERSFEDLIVKALINAHKPILTHNQDNVSYAIGSKKFLVVNWDEHTLKTYEYGSLGVSSGQSQVFIDPAKFDQQSPSQLQILTDSEGYIITNYSKEFHQSLLEKV